MVVNNSIKQKKAVKKVSKKSNSDDMQKLLDQYRMMLLIRRFEEKSGQLYGMGLIGGFCHLYIGQEAVVVGMQSTITEKDSVITSYRDHGHMLACGMSPGGVLAELMGRQDGYSRGKGGSMHMFSREKNFYGGHGIVGAQVPLGTGIAFANKYKETQDVCLVYVGDGAMNQGQVYEAFNMAALWKLPVIYVIENNKYGMGTSVERISAGGGELFKRGEAYGIKGVAVDGMDVQQVAQAGEKAVKYCRDGHGPMILEMNTYRYRGHSMSDPAKYRNKEEVQKMRETKDPIDQLKKLLLVNSYIDEDKIKAIDQEVKQEISRAVEFAKNSPEPDISELYTDILI